MSDVSYYVPSAAIHSFLMFAPFFVMKSNMIIQGFFLWLAGPYLAAWISPNLMEQGTSILLIAFLLLYLLALHLDTSANKTSFNLVLLFDWPNWNYVIPYS